jgi:hypothetical protein
MPLRSCCLRQGAIVRFSRDIQLIYSFTKGRWKRFGNFRSFHSGISDVTEGQRQTRLQENGWEPWLNGISRTASKADQVDNRNIVIGNLDATLEAHRTANRIRKVYLSHQWKSIDFRQLDGPGQPPENELSLHENDKASHTTTDEKEARMHCLRVSATTRHLRFDTRLGEKNLGKAEYIGKNLTPVKQWELCEKPKTSKSLEWESPWLCFVISTGCYGPSRFVCCLAYPKRSNYGSTDCPRRSLPTRSICG